MRFNPPPNWPVPRDGWTPPTGWEPDPKWGPAPVGWPLWLPDSYGQPPSAADPRAGSTNVLAMLSLVMAFVFAPAGIVLGHVALSQIKRTRERGHGLAVAGLVCGYLSVAIALVVVIALATTFSALNGESRSDTAAPMTSTSVTPTYDSGIQIDPRFADWKLSLDGFGPVKLGMSTAELAAMDGIVRGDSEYCDYPVFHWTGMLHEDDPSYQDSAPIGYIYVNAQGVVSQISVSGEVDSPLLDTGITGGSSYADLAAAYGDRLIASAGSAGGGADGGYAVNGSTGYLYFYVQDGVVQSASGIILLAGNVTPETVPSSFRCEQVS